MLLTSICYSLILIKLISASNNNIRQRPQVDGNTIIFDGLSWKNIDKEIFKFYKTCDTVIIRNTNISHFPSGLCKLKNLHTIECINNLKLATWTNLFNNLYNSSKKIKKLTLDGNKRHCISVNFKEFINLEELTITNSVKKVIQKLYSLNKCTNLITLNLSNNKIIELPNKIHELKKLKHLNLSNNYIKELPADFYRLNTLEYLNLSENLLKEVKPEIAALSKLKRLNLSNNQLSDLPTSFYSLSNLIKLNISKNSLLTISPDIYKLHNLQSLNLGNNKLETVPIELCNLQKLEVLKLNQNLLSTIPSVVFLLTNLKELYVKNNKIKNILLDNETLDSVKQSATEFSKHNTECSNNFSDALNLNTSTIFSNLNILDISYNHLTEIRSELSILKHLKILNASYNKISTFAVKLSDWPELKHLNLCTNKLTLAPYFENNYDVSNIKLDVSKNSICDDNLNGCGYGLKQLQNFKFNRLRIYPQQKNKQIYENVIQEENENTILWNLTSLNKLRISNADVYNTNIIITDYFLMKIWHSIIKWLVYDSNTNSDFEYNAAYITTEELAILFNKIIHSGIIEQLKQNPGYCGDTLITNKFSDRIINTIHLKNSIPNDLTSSVFLSYIKLTFKQVLEEIDEAGNNLEKITNLRNKVTEFCSLCVDNTIEEAIEQLIHRYSLNYQFVYENSDAKFESFIYSRVNFYRELAFYEACKKFYHNNTEYHYILRSKFANQIGIYDVNISRKIDVMSELDINIFIKEFFNLFYFENVQNSILLEIKGTIAIDALEFLKTHEKNNLNNHIDSSNNSLLHLTTQEIDKLVENKVIKKYYTIIKSSHDLVSFSLNSTGMIEILRILGFVYDSMNTNN